MIIHAGLMKHLFVSNMLIYILLYLYYFYNY